MVKLKNIAVFATLAFGLASCSQISKEVVVVDNMSNRVLQHPLVAELKAQPRAELTMSGDELKGAVSPEKFVTANLLKQTNADVLLEKRTTMKTKWTLLGRKIKSLTVSGVPATYHNIHSETQADADLFINPPCGCPKGSSCEHQKGGEKKVVRLFSSSKEDKEKKTAAPAMSSTKEPKRLRFGVHGALNVANLDHEDKDLPILSPDLGVDLRLPVFGNFSLKSGVEFKQKGAALDDGYGSWNIRSTFMQFPLALSYDIKASNDLSVNLDFGGFLAANLSDDGDGYLHDGDGGLRFGLGITSKPMKMNLGIYYDYGLFNHMVNDYECHTGNASIRLTYWF